MSVLMGVVLGVILGFIVGVVVGFVGCSYAMGTKLETYHIVPDGGGMWHWGKKRE